MKKIVTSVTIMCIFICMFNIVFATENIETEKEKKLSGDNEEKQTTQITAETYEFKTLRGKVIEAKEPEEINGEKCQELKVYIDDKGYKASALITYKMSFYEDTTNYAEPFKEGDKVYVYTTFENEKIVATEIAYRDNTKYLITTITLFIITVILIGGIKGIKSLISLIITIGLIFYVLVPQIMLGKKPLLITTLLSIVIIIISFIIIAGFSKKSLSAMLGTVGGILVAGAFAIIFGNIMHLTGMVEETGLLAGLSDAAKNFDFRGMLFSGIIIGALGACMDVGMSISSALYELKTEKNEMTTKGLIKSGMNIGKDMIGTMTNTLILAYTGGALITILIFALGDLDLYEMLNKEILLEEIIRSIAGSIGLICTIPLTTLASGILMGSMKKQRR